MKYAFILLTFIANLCLAQSRIDVLVLYPNTVASKLGTNTIVQAANFIAQGNSALTTSNINLQLNLLDAVQIDGYSNTACNSSVVSSLESNSEVTNLRRLYKPHLTILLCDNPLNNISGNANFPSTSSNNGASKALSVALYTQAYTFVHELGHNLGVGHGKRTNTINYGNPITSSMGYGVIDNYRDIMTYSEAFGNAPQYLFFSNPAITTCIGQSNSTCGTSQYNAAAGISSVYSNYVSLYPDYWKSTPPTFKTNFVFNFDQTFVTNEVIDMFAPYYKVICNSRPGQWTNCSYTTIKPGTYRFRGSNNIVWDPSVCNSIEGEFCTITINENHNGKTIAMGIKQKTIKTTLNTQKIGYGSLNYADQTKTICSLENSPATNSCSVVYETPAAQGQNTKILLTISSPFHSASYGWNNCEKIINGDQCEVTLNGGVKNISAYVDYD